MKTRAGRRQARYRAPTLKARAATPARPKIKPPVTPGGKPLNKLQPDTRLRLDPQANQTALKTSQAARHGTSLVWRTEPNCCPTCDALDGTVVRPGQQFPRVAPVSEKSWWNTHPRPGPPGHPNCLPSGALISSCARITGATARVYDGRMIEFRTLGKQEFACTANHPVLTGRGWVAAHLLREGDRVVRAARGQRELGCHQHDEHVVAPIEEVAKAFLGSSEVASREMPVSAEDFHGDGTGSEVAVVGTLGGLARQREASSDQDAAEPAFAGLGPARQLVGAGHAPPRGLVGSGSVRGALCGAHVGRALELCGASTSWLASTFAEPAPHDRPTDAETIARRLGRFAEVEALDEVVRVGTYHWSGHVYNLQTDAGWYTHNDIVTHNCHCDLEEV